MQTEFEGSFKIDPSSEYTAKDIILIFLGFDIDKVRQNNWRKQHGIPMKRRRNAKPK